MFEQQNTKFDVPRLSPVQSANIKSGIGRAVNEECEIFRREDSHGLKTKRNVETSGYLNQSKAIQSRTFGDDSFNKPLEIDLTAKTIAGAYVSAENAYRLNPNDANKLRVDSTFADYTASLRKSNVCSHCFKALRFKNAVVYQVLPLIDELTQMFTGNIDLAKTSMLDRLSAKVRDSLVAEYRRITRITRANRLEFDERLALFAKQVQAKLDGLDIPESPKDNKVSFVSQDLKSYKPQATFFYADIKPYYRVFTKGDFVVYALMANAYDDTGEIPIREQLRKNDAGAFYTECLDRQGEVMTGFCPPVKYRVNGDEQNVACTCVR